MRAAIQRLCKRRPHKPSSHADPRGDAAYQEYLYRQATEGQRCQWVIITSDRTS